MEVNFLHKSSLNTNAWQKWKKKKKHLSIKQNDGYKMTVLTYENNYFAVVKTIGTQQLKISLRSKYSKMYFHNVDALI